MEITELHDILSFVVGLAALGLGLSVFLRGRDQLLYQVFFVFTSFFALSSLFSGLICMSPDEDLALLFGRLMVFTVVIMFGVFLVMCTMFLPQPHRGAVFRHRWPVAVLIMVMAVSSGWTLDSVTYFDHGWVIDFAPGLHPLVVSVTALAIISVVVLQYSSSLSTDPNFRRQAHLLSLSIITPLLFGLAIIIAGFILGTALPFTFPLAFLVTILVLIYTVLRHELIIVVPAFEEELLRQDHSDTPLMLPGISYLVEGKKPELAFTMLCDELKRGGQGLVITSEHPDQVRQRYGLQQTPIIWISSQPGMDRVEPNNLSIMHMTVQEFLRKSERPVLLLDGIDVLLAHNPLSKVLQYILTVRDEMLVHNGQLIVPLDPETLEMQPLAYIERDLEVIDDMPAGRTLALMRGYGNYQGYGE